MKFLAFMLAASAITFTAACGPAASNNTTNVSPVVSATPVPAAPGNGDYPAKGKVSKIDAKRGSIELDHEAIKDVKPAKKTELFVIDSAILKGISVGDTVEFVLRHKDGQEIVTELKKAN
ncbi:MAG: copper-binding protein [Acidobacteriota bacterium]